jgi:hypothetical protein
MNRNYSSQVRSPRAARNGSDSHMRSAGHKFPTIGILPFIWFLLWSESELFGSVVCCTGCCCEVRLSVLVLRRVVPDVAVRWGWVSWYSTRCCCEVRLSILLLRCVVPDVAVRWGWVSWHCSILYQMFLWGEAESLSTVVCFIRCCCEVRLSVLFLRTQMYLFSLVADGVWFMKYLCSAFGRGSRQPSERNLSDSHFFLQERDF